MFSPSLSAMKIPDTVWLPPEIRSELESGSPISERQVVTPRNILKHHVDCLLARVEHIELMLRQLDVETRISKLERPASSLPSRASGA
jgi:hypothetical protein